MKLKSDTNTHTEASPLVIEANRILHGVQSITSNVRSMIENAADIPSNAQGEVFTGVDDVRKKLQVLHSLPDLPPTEFLEKSKLSAASSFLQEQETSLKRTRDRLQRGKRKIDQHVAKLRDGMCARISDVFSGKGRKGLRVSAEISKKVGVLFTQVGEIHALQSEIARVSPFFSSAREAAVLSEVKTAIGRMYDAYKALAKRMTDDEDLMKEIREAHIRKVVAPEVENLLKTEKYPEKKRTKFWKVFRSYLPEARNIQSYEQAREHFSKLSHAMPYGMDSVVLKNRAMLVEDGEKVMVQELAIDLMMRDIARIQESLDAAKQRREISAEHALRDVIRERNKASAEEHPNPPLRASLDRESEPGSFDALLMLAAKRHTSTRYPDRRLQSLRGIASCRTAHEILAPALQKQEQECIDSIIQRALNNDSSHEIGFMRLCPTPEAIRNTILLAANDTGHPTEHANYLLAELRNRPDWKEILDEAERAYPRLKPLRSILESWDHKKGGSHPDLRRLAADFSMNIFETTPNDDLRMTAARALPNADILSRLATKGIISEATALSLQQGEKLLIEISEKTEREREERFAKSENASQANESLPTEEPENLHYIYHRTFSSELNRVLVNILEGERWHHRIEMRMISGKEAPSLEEQVTKIERLAAISQSIAAHQEDPIALAYLSEQRVIEAVQRTSLSTENLPCFLQAYARIPALARDENLLRHFCKNFSGEESIQFYANIVEAYKDLPDSLSGVLQLVENKELSASRALELPEKAKDTLGTRAFAIAKNFPEVLLTTDDGIALLRTIATGNGTSPEAALDVRIGQHLLTLHPDTVHRFFKVLGGQHIKENIEACFHLPNGVVDINQQWLTTILGYAASQPDAGDFQLSEKAGENVQKLFADTNNRDLCLQKLQAVWKEYLKNSKHQPGIPFTLMLLTEFLQETGGAWHLTQVTSLSNFMHAYSASIQRESVRPDTQSQLCSGVSLVEARFTRERFSEEEKRNFYDISCDVMRASPALFTNYLALFQQLKPAHFKQFLQDLYPLHRTILALLEKDEKSGSKHRDEDLIPIRREIDAFPTMLQERGVVAFSECHAKLLQDIRTIFKDRFGIIKIPETLGEHEVRSVINVSMYLANLKNRDTTKEAILGYYLALMINGKWEDFRSGESIKPNEYLLPERAKMIEQLLAQQAKNPVFIPEVLGISAEKISTFSLAAQQEVQNVAIGDTETVDVRLGKIVGNIRELEDPDLYPNPLDRRRMELLKKYGSANFTQGVARMYRFLGGKSAPEDAIAQDIHTALVENGIAVDQTTLNQHFQVDMQPFALARKLLDAVHENKLEEEITKLREILKPSATVISIFSKMGEEFTPSSGALALSQDLDYLEKLLMNHEKKLIPEERTTLSTYIQRIREQVVKLQRIDDDLVKILPKTFSTQGSPLREKLGRIVSVMNHTATEQVLTSTATGDINQIIEHMRECLACTKQGANNDTNLTFGDGNKFYVYTRAGQQKARSIADQIVFLEPVTYPDGKKGMTFVFDRVYDTKTPSILVNHARVVAKKCRKLQEEFPGVQLSLFITSAAMADICDNDSFCEKFKAAESNCTCTQKKLTVDVLPSAWGDHYVEFGEEARKSGPRTVNGIVITLK